MLTCRKAKRKTVYIRKNDKQKEKLRKLKEMLDRWSEPLIPKLLRLWRSKQETITLEDVTKLLMLYQAGRFKINNFSSSLNTKTFADETLKPMLSGVSAETFQSTATDFPDINTPLTEQSFLNWYQTTNFADFDIKFDNSMFSEIQTETAIIEPMVGVAPNIVTSPNAGLNFENILTNYINDYSAQWVKDIDMVQMSNIRTVLNGVVNNRYDVRTATQQIKNSIGLTERQFGAAEKYYNTVRSNYVKNNPDLSPGEINRLAYDATFKYTERQRLSRATTIANTEIAIAHNQAYDLYIRQAQKQGLMGKVALRWLTAKNDMVCEECASLDGKTISIDGEFDTSLMFCGNQKRLPPAHPNCRCTVEYIETEKPEYVQDTSWYDSMTEAEKKAFHNKVSDNKQWERYKTVLGKENLPKTLEEFQEIKYNNTDKWSFVRLDYERQNKLINNPQLVLPNADKVTADDRKFTEYLFSGKNQKGLIKGKNITDRLGYDDKNYNDFKNAILNKANKYPAIFKDEDEFGKRYEQKIILYGIKDKPANVVVGWKTKGEETWMTSAYIKEVK